MTQGARLPPSLDELAALAEAAFAALPAAFRALAGEVVFRIEDFPDDEVMAAMGVEDPFELSGLYVGVDLTQRMATEPPLAPAMVFLYRRALLDEWIERGDEPLDTLVAHVLVHEIGHHFGLSDEAMDALLDSTP